MEFKRGVAEETWSPSYVGVTADSEGSKALEEELSTRPTPSVRRNKLLIRRKHFKGQTEREKAAEVAQRELEVEPLEFEDSNLVPVGAPQIQSRREFEHVEVIPSEVECEDESASPTTRPSIANGSAISYLKGFGLALDLRIYQIL
ncbi:hypothetical protein R1flu_002238 [Riccia fluitans]|uniref:Uncharacterized protein n=1 Tax=Riccia fluitans TaxID=41844 RepID=A0ABD1Y5I6_9MARC